MLIVIFWLKLGSITCFKMSLVYYLFSFCFIVAIGAKLSTITRNFCQTLRKGAKAVMPVFTKISLHRKRGTYLNDRMYTKYIEYIYYFKAIV